MTKDFEQALFGALVGAAGTTVIALGPPPVWVVWLMAIATLVAALIGLFALADPWGQGWISRRQKDAKNCSVVLAGFAYGSAIAAAIALVCTTGF